MSDNYDETQNQDDNSSFETIINLEGLAVQHNFIPVDLPRLTCSLEAEGYLRKLGRQPQTNQPWLPISSVGPIMILVHHDPSSTDFWGVPNYLSTKAVVSKVQYDAIFNDFMNRISNNPLPQTNNYENLPNPNIPPGDLDSAFDWLLQNYPYSDQEKTHLNKYYSEIKESKGELSITDFNSIKQHLGIALKYITEPNIFIFNPDDSPSQEVFPNHLLDKYNVYPLYTGKKTVYLLDEVGDYFSFEDEWLSQGNDPYDIIPVFADKKSIKNAIQRNSSNITGAVVEIDETANEISITNFENVIEISPDDVGKVDPSNVNHSVDEILHWALYFAITSGASDFHIEKYYNTVRFRIRLDGNLRVIYSALEEQLPRFIALIKNAAKMGQSRQEAQDGRYTILIGKRQVDVRVAAVPTRGQYQKIIMRFLDKQAGLKKLSDLNLSARHSEIVDDIMGRDQGLCLITGPTGSGKTTTLYALLQSVNNDDVNIQTIEDPIEYEIEGINQTQVDEAFSLDFANGLRALMRADPDIILIGETRDIETASAAVNASLTGHLVLSTLHANDSLRAVSRLLAMDVEPFLLADSLAMSQAQRLIRRLCGYCKKPIEATQKDQEHFYQQKMITQVISDPIFEAIGCSQCRDTGYSGRIALMEICRVNVELSDLIARNAPQSEMRKIARAEGVLTLYQEGIGQVIKGQTTLKEIKQLSYTAI